MVTQSILQLFPEELRGIFTYAAQRQAFIQEIRLRAGKPIYVIENGQERFLDRQGHYVEGQRSKALPEEGFRQSGIFAGTWTQQEERMSGDGIRHRERAMPGEGAQQARILSGEELLRIVNHICKYSLYAYEDELRQGFLTVPGGHRVGIVGQAVLNDREEVKTLKHISALNIRISHQVKGAADKIMPYIYQDGKLQNTIIISPPGCGKTTLLRDMIRQVSDGNAYGKGISVGVVDERSEIAGSFQGCPQNDVGIRTDVLDSCPKVKGMLMLIRSMSPGAVAIDELGEAQEWKALRYASYCGTAVLATMHGEGLEDYERRREICLPQQSGVNSPLQARVGLQQCSSSLSQESEVCLQQSGSSSPQHNEIFQVCIVLRRYQEKCVIEQIYKAKAEGEWECLFQR